MTMLCCQTELGTIYIAITVFENKTSICILYFNKKFTLKNYNSINLVRRKELKILKGRTKYGRSKLNKHHIVLPYSQGNANGLTLTITERIPFTWPPGRKMKGL